MRDIPIHSQSIIQMDLLNKSIPIFLGFLSIRSKVEVKISHLTFISSISIEDHLDICLLRDLLGNEILANWSTNGGDVEGFSNIDYIFDALETLLGLVDEFGVIGTDMLGYFSCIDYISAFFHTNRESSKLLSSLSQKVSSHTGNQAGV